MSTSITLDIDTSADNTQLTQFYSLVKITSGETRYNFVSAHVDCLKALAEALKDFHIYTNVEPESFAIDNVQIEQGCGDVYAAKIAARRNNCN